MRRASLLVGIAMVGGAALGWLSAAPPGPRAAQSNTAPLAHAGEVAGESAERLAALGLGVDALATPAAPAPPDIAVLFRRELTAIEQRGRVMLAVIVDHSQNYGRRTLRVGDIYQDGWRVAAIGPQRIELRRRRERRSVAVFDAPQEAPQ